MKNVLYIVVPCYNEEEVLEQTTKILKNKIENLIDSKKINSKSKIVYVNDGSKDNTLSLLKTLANKDEHVKYFSFSRNFGKESAMYAGFCNATGDFVAVMDADMQDPPSILPKMIEILEKDGYDSVATRRTTRKGEPIIRSYFAKQFYKIINKISDADIVDGARDFRLMKKDMVDAIVAMSENNRFSKGIFGWIGFKTYWLPYENIERVAGVTKWNFWKLCVYAIDGIISFSNAPLSLSLIHI